MIFFGLNHLMFHLRLTRFYSKVHKTWNYNMKKRSRIFYACVSLLVPYMSISQTLPTVEIKNPFIQTLLYSDDMLEHVEKVQVIVESKPDAYTPDLQYTVHATYYNQHIKNNQHEIPVFGLYQNYDNHVTINLLDENENVIQSDPYVLHSDVYVDHQSIKAGFSWHEYATYKDSIRLSYEHEVPSFHYFSLKPLFKTSPLIMDIDGEIRWIAPHDPQKNYLYKFFNKKNHSFIGIGLDGQHKPEELDKPRFVDGYELLDNHHNVKQGKYEHTRFELINNSTEKNLRMETTLYEIDNQTHQILKSWDLGDIIKKTLQKSEDEVKHFIRTDKSYVEPIIPESQSAKAMYFYDWCHINDTLYDPQTDTITFSCREQFLININYDLNKNPQPINWIFSSKEKEWYKYEALHPFLLDIEVDPRVTFENQPLTREIYIQNRLHPIGQHSLSMTNEGHLLLMNNGAGSHPRGGEYFGTYVDPIREMSLIQEYKINLKEHKIKLMWQYNPHLFTFASSSVYRDSNGHYLINYSAASDKTQNIIEIITKKKDILFTLSMPRENTTSSGHLVWNAEILDLSKIELR